MNPRAPRPPLLLSDIPLPTNITFISNNNNNNNNNNENIPFQPLRSAPSPSSSLSPASSSSSTSPSPSPSPAPPPPPPPSSSSNQYSSTNTSSPTFNPTVDALSIGAFTTLFNNNGNSTITNYNTPDRHAQSQSLYMHPPATNPAIRQPAASSSRPSFLNMLSPSLSPSTILSSVDNLNLNIPGVDLNAGDRNMSNLSETSQLQAMLETQLNVSTSANTVSTTLPSNNNNNVTMSDAQSTYAYSNISPSPSLSSSLSSSSSSQANPASSPQVKLALFFLHPVPSSNLLTVMKCLQPFPQDILLDSRDINHFLLGYFYICTMEEKEVLSIFPMSKPIMRWGIYHKVTRQLLFSSFYRFNCAFGAKGFFTYDTFLDKGHFGFGQEDIFLQQEDVKEKLWKICLSVLRDKFGVNI